MTAPKRILVAKPGLDGHDRGAKVVARALRDAGFEVIYTGLRQTPAQIAQAAVQEDVDAVGLSSLSGAHRELFPAVVRALREAGAGDVVIFGGGVIPQEDVAVLLEAGIERLFPPGTDTREIVRFLRERLGVGGGSGRERLDQRRRQLVPEPQVVGDALGREVVVVNSGAHHHRCVEGSGEPLGQRARERLLAVRRDGDDRARDADAGRTAPRSRAAGRARRTRRAAARRR